MSKIKQVMVMREDLGMSPGKLAAQTAHASLSAYDKANKHDIDKWKREGTTKIVLGVGSESELIDIYKRAVAAYLPASLIADEGRTDVPPGTITGGGIGPAPANEIDKITGQLSLYGKS
jgi:peptidyl-tRNA hydrolase, PTH2 family